MGERTKKPARRSGWRHWKADEARRVVEAWRASGLPLATFARKRGLCAERIRWWRQRLGDWSPPSEEALRLIPATVTGFTPTATGAVLTVRAPGDVVVEVAVGEVLDGVDVEEGATAQHRVHDGGPLGPRRSPIALPRADDGGS